MKELKTETSINYRHKREFLVMAYANKDKKIIFIHIPRTGGTSLEWALRKKSDDCLKKHGSVSHMKHATIPYFSKATKIDFSDWTKVIIVRNPWDQLVSWYEWLRTEEGSKVLQTGVKFEDFVRNQYSTQPSTTTFYDQINTYNKRANNLQYFLQDFDLQKDVFKKFEDYDQTFMDIMYMCTDFTHNPNNFVRTHSGPPKKKPYQEYYTNDIRDLVYSRNESFCEQFNYRFE